MLAAKNGYTEVVRVLLEHGVQLNQKCNQGSALMLAEAAGHAEIVMLLKKYGALN